MKTQYIYIIAGLLILFILYFVMKRIGLIRGKELKKVDAARAAAKVQKAEVKAEKKQIITILNTTDAFNPNMYKTALNPRKLTEKSALNVAGILRTAMKGIGTDETAIYGILRKIPAKTEVSQVADIYQRQYKRDLLGDLTDELNKSELQIVYNIVQNME